MHRLLGHGRDDGCLPRGSTFWLHGERQRQLLQTLVVQAGGGRPGGEQEEEEDVHKQQPANPCKDISTPFSEIRGLHESLMVIMYIVTCHKIVPDDDGNLGSQQCTFCSLQIVIDHRSIAWQNLHVWSSACFRACT